MSNHKFISKMMCKDNTYSSKIIIIFTFCFTFVLIIILITLKIINISTQSTFFEKNSNRF